MQSVITLVKEYFFRKSSGIDWSIASWEGDMLSFASLTSMKFIQEIKIRLTMETEIWKKCAKWSLAKPYPSLHITAKNHQVALKFSIFLFSANNCLSLI